MNAQPHRLGLWLLAGEWRAHPVRVLVALAAIALGIALGFGIHLVNSAAFNEFSAAARSLSGSADLQLRGRNPQFDEAIYAQVSNIDRKSTRLNSSHSQQSRMPSSA